MEVKLSLLQMQLIANINCSLVELPSAKLQLAMHLGEVQ